MHLKSQLTPKVYEITSHFDTQSQVCPYLFSEGQLGRYGRALFWLLALGQVPDTRKGTTSELFPGRQESQLPGCLCRQYCPDIDWHTGTQCLSFWFWQVLADSLHAGFASTPSLKAVPSQLPPQTRVAPKEGEK